MLQFPLAYILGKHTQYGLNGLWYAFPTATIVTTLLAVVWFMKGDWKRSRLTQAEAFAERVSEEVLVEEGGR